MAARPSITIVVDPRFRGGTSSAVATEIGVLATRADLRVVALSSRMFSGDEAHPAIQSICEHHGISIEWDPPIISNSVVVIHNPSFIKFDDHFPAKIIADQIFVVCHENFLRPGGAEGFAVQHCLDQIRDATLCRNRQLAPISPWNRKTVTKWIENHGGFSGWTITELDWTNICAFDLVAPTSAPQDRRGRLSRPGPEKFPSMEILHLLYPRTCDAVRILGGDSLLAEKTPDAWDLIPFGGEDVDAFLATIDFFVYFTNPLWRESFGRVIGEAVAAGKLVVTDPETATIFGPGVIGTTPDQVSAVIAEHIDNPDLYVERVRTAQSDLARFAPEAFAERLAKMIGTPIPPLKRAPTKKEELDVFV